jgi:hypothetical protein
VDKVINSHIDKVEEIERQLDLIIEQEIMQIDIDMVLADPKVALEEVAENIKSIFLDKYAHDAIELGFDFGRLVQKKIEHNKTLTVDKSNNPTLNDTSTGNKQD